MTASQATKPTSIPLPDRAFFRGIFASYRRLLVFVKPYWQRLTLAGVIVTVNSLLGLVLPLVIRGIIDSKLVVANQQLLNRVTLLLLAIFVIQAFLGFGQIYLLSWVGERVVANLRKALYGHLQSMPLRFFAGHTNRRADLPAGHRCDDHPGCGHYDPAEPGVADDHAGRRLDYHLRDVVAVDPDDAGDRCHRRDRDDPAGPLGAQDQPAGAGHAGRDIRNGRRGAGRYSDRQVVRT